MGWWDWLNGRKTAIGVLLDLLHSGISALILWAPQLGEALAGLGVAGDWVSVVVLALGKVLMVVGVIHKIIKGVFGANQPVR